MKTLDQLNELIRAALAAARPQLPPEPKALAEARGRVLAAPVLSPLAIPAADLSAMDGYAQRRRRPLPARRREQRRPPLPGAT